MIGRESAPFAELKRLVHRDSSVDDNTVVKRASDASRRIADYGSAIRYDTKDSEVIKVG